MKRNSSNIVLLIILVIISCGNFFSSCKEGSMEGAIIITQVAGDLHDNNYLTGNTWRYKPEARIVAVKPNISGESPKVLTKGFFSACSPQISYDGKFMIFAAQKKKNNIWQIWEMNLESLKVRQITFSTESCIDPAYLPGERFG